MKQALNTLFITTPGTWLSLRNNNVVVKIDGVDNDAGDVALAEEQQRRRENRRSGEERG